MHAVCYARRCAAARTYGEILWNTAVGRNNRPPTSEEPMKTSRFTEEQMVEILRETDKVPVPEVARKHKVSEQMIYIWRKRFGLVDPRCQLHLQHPSSRVGT